MVLSPAVHTIGCCMLSFLPYRSTALILPRSELANLAEPLFFLSFKSILTVVGPVELWATRERRPSAAANPQGFLAPLSRIAVLRTIADHAGLAMGAAPGFGGPIRGAAAHWQAGQSRAGWAMRAIAQIKPTISRAIAVVTTTFGLPDAANRRYRAHSRTWAFHAMSRMAADSGSRRS